MGMRQNTGMKNHYRKSKRYFNQSRSPDYPISRFAPNITQVKLTD